MACLAQESAGAVARDMVGYVLANAVFLNFLHTDVAQVVANLPTPAINPSLWTLKIEVGFYLVLPFLWMLVRRQGAWVMGVIFLLSFAYAEILNRMGMNELAKQLPGQLQFFVLGMALYRYRDALPAARDFKGRLMWGAVMLAAFAFASVEMRTPLLYPIAMAVLVFGIACRTGALDLRLDLSYGVYLAHGPVIQLALLFGVFQDNATGFICAGLAVIGLAMVAERVVERPFIAIGKQLSKPVPPARRSAVPQPV
jgi:peptidoglycan/LPS O-acetylase OafA/YrhL